MHFKLKLKNLRVTVPYNHNRSNTENIECRPVMSPFQLPLTKELIMSSYHLERRILRHTSFPHSMHRPASPPTSSLAPSTSVAFFVTLRFFDLVPYVLILKTFHVKSP